MRVVGLVQQPGALQPTRLCLDMLIVGTQAMVPHVIKLQKIGIAMRALVPLASMSSYVGLQVVTLAEALGALITLVRTFARMGAHVYGQIVGAMEALAASIAQIGLGTGVVPVNQIPFVRADSQTVDIRSLIPTYRSCTLRSVARGNALMQ